MEIKNGRKNWKLAAKIVKDGDIDRFDNFEPELSPEIAAALRELAEYKPEILLEAINQAISPSIALSDDEAEKRSRQPASMVADCLSSLSGLIERGQLPFVKKTLSAFHTAYCY